MNSPPTSGQAKVRLGRDDFYLGKHGTPESYAKYYALLAEYNSNGKVAPASRSYANDQTRKVVRIIEHGVSRELVGPDRIVALRALSPLKRGQAKDNPKRSSVSLEVIRATLPHLTGTLVAMIKLQLAIDCHEAAAITPYCVLVALAPRSGAGCNAQPVPVSGE